MPRDSERIERIQRALGEAQVDGLICTLPIYVLLLTGYWPVVGTSIAIFTRGGEVQLLAPEDERDLAQKSWADKVHYFKPASLDELRSAEDAIRDPLREAAAKMNLEHARIGYEHGPASEPSSYAAMNLYGASILDVFREVIPGATFLPLDDVLARLAAVKTAREVECLQHTCTIAERAFWRGSAKLQPGMTEIEVAGIFRMYLGLEGTGQKGSERADGFAFCMSGPNAARAYGAYARSRNRRITRSDLILVHCNSYADGYWSDITRTYSLWRIDEKKERIYQVVLEARQAALAAIRPGVKASEVDHAARELLTQRGFGKEFRHPTGHGVGFSAISHNARPRIHPKSPEVLETGMVFNIEPAVYIEGYGGVRHCDVVAVTTNGARVLTNFQSRLGDLVLDGSYSDSAAA
jgi:Xaa-Pro aminopeptidase